MAKMKGIIIGDASGKVGNTVAKVVAGEQIVSKYQPEVANPNTAAQVDTRSKFKLMSQLAASMKGEVAIPRKGLQSGRNRFVRTNFDLVSYEDGVAAIDLNKVQLTASRRPLGTLSVDRSSGTTIQCSVAVKPTMFEKVVVCVYRKSDDEKLEYVGSSIADVDASGTTVLSLPYTSDAVVTYAYGIAYSSAATRAKYGNLEADPARQIASLVQSSSATTGAARFSKTLGCTMGVGETSATTYVYNFAIASVNGVKNGPAALKLNGNSVVVSRAIPSGSNVSVEGYYYQDQGAEIYHFDGSSVSYNGKTITFSTTGIAGKYIKEITITIDGLSNTKVLPNQLPPANCNFALPKAASSFNSDSTYIQIDGGLTLQEIVDKMTITYENEGTMYPTRGVIDGSSVDFIVDGFNDYIIASVMGDNINLSSGIAIPQWVIDIEIEGYHMVYQE